MRVLNNTIPLCPAEAGHLPQGGENTRQFIGFVSIVEFSPPRRRKYSSVYWICLYCRIFSPCKGGVPEGRGGKSLSYNPAQP